MIVLLFPRNLRVFFLFFFTIIVVNALCDNDSSNMVKKDMSPINKKFISDDDLFTFVKEFENESEISLMKDSNIFNSM